MKFSRFYWHEVVIILLAIAALLTLLCGCGTKREEVQHIEHQDQDTTRTTTVATTTKPTPQGPAVAETTTTTILTEHVAHGTQDARLDSVTTIQAPEIKAVIGAVAGIAAPGFGSLFGGALSWLTSTPEGAATGLSVGTLLTGLTKRAISKEIELKKTKRHFRAVVKGNSDFMQAHPEHADKLKQAQRSAQADPHLKASVVAARVEEGQV